MGKKDAAEGEGEVVATEPRRTRGAILEELAAAGWTGPTSYGKERLEEILADVKAGKEVATPKRGRKGTAAEETVAA